MNSTEAKGSTLGSRGRSLEHYCGGGQGRRGGAGPGWEMYELGMLAVT